MRRNRQVWFQILMVVATAASASAAPAAPAPARPVAKAMAAPKLVTTVEGITEYQLDNGLRVLLFPDDSQPKLTVAVTYMVGSRLEGYGETGMAHLLEHMQFKGTPRHKEIWAELQQHGANFNASTSYDRTEYHEMMPASDENLAYAIDLEADRMVNSNIANDDLQHEFTVVRNEFERGENSPERILEERVMSTAYLWHNYGKSTIGSRSDIERVPIQNLKEFYKKFYQPDNAMLVIAGKIDPKKTLDLVNQKFGAIPRPTRQLSTSYTVEPVQDGERQVILRRVGDVQVVDIVYHTVAGPDERFAATEALAFLMTDQPNGRLYKALVATGLATEVSAGADDMAEPGVIEFTATVPVGKSLDVVKDKIIAIVEGVAKQPPTAEELAHFKAREVKNFELNLTDSQRIAQRLAEFAAQGDWRLFFVHRDRAENVTAAQVAQVATDFIKGSNRTVGMFIPTKSPERSPLPGNPDVASIVKDYKGHDAMQAGEEFEATIDNVEKRTMRTTLSNGMKLAFLPRQTRGKMVKLSLALHFGTEKDFVNHEEAASMVGSMLSRGSKKLTYQQIKDEMDRLKIQGGFSAGTGDASFSVATTRDNLLDAIAFGAELMQEPAFPADQFEILKKQELSDLEEGRSDPQAVASRELQRRMSPYPKTDIRYVPTLDEEIERTKAMTLDDVKRMYKTLWGANHAELTIVGDFDPGEVKAALEKQLAAWKTNKPYERITNPYKKVDGAQVELDTPDKENAVVIMSQPIEMRDDDPDYPALVMANFIIGGNADSRLFNRLRQKEGWSYGTGSQLGADSLDKRGQFAAFAICAPQNAEKTANGIVEEVDRFLKDGPTADELAKAKTSYKASFANRLTNDQYLTSVLNRGLFVGRTMTYNQKLNDAIDKLSLDDLRAVMKKGYLRTDGLVRVIAVDKKKMSQKSAGGVSNPPAAPPT